MERPTASMGAVFGLLWWIIAAIVLFQNGPVDALEWMTIPYVVIAAHEFGHWVAAWVAAWAARVPLAGAVVRIGAGLDIGVERGCVRLGILPGGGAGRVGCRPRTLAAIPHRSRRPAGSATIGTGLAIIATQMHHPPTLFAVPALMSVAVAVGNLIPLRWIPLGQTDAYEALRALLSR